MTLSFFNSLPCYFGGLGLGFLPILSPKRGGGSLLSETANSLGFLSNSTIWRWSLLSCVPCLVNVTSKFRFHQLPTTTATRPTPTRRVVGVGGGGGCSVPLFRPYVAKVPWHKGARAFLSQFFPRYGHYCGPNWSSGKDKGSHLWDKRPMDWLDFCCYCHDIGYDTHDQSYLLKADLTFLDCLERQRPAPVPAPVPHFYTTLYIAGLRNILIPYRKHLVRLQERQPLIEWLGNLKRKNGSCRETCRDNESYECDGVRHSGTSPNVQIQRASQRALC